MQEHRNVQHATVRFLLPVPAPCPKQDAQTPAGFYGSSWTIWSEVHNRMPVEGEQANVSCENLLGTVK